METEDLKILLKKTEIDIQLAELEEKQRKVNRKKRRRIRVQWTRDWIMRRTLFGQYENLLAELNREDPKRYRNFLRVDNDLFEQLLQKVSPYITKKTTNWRQVTVLWLLLVSCVVYYIYCILLSFICIIKPNCYQCLCFQEAAWTRPEACSNTQTHGNRCHLQAADVFLQSGREHHLPVSAKSSGGPHRDSEGWSDATPRGTQTVKGSQWQVPGQMELSSCLQGTEREAHPHQSSTKVQFHVPQLQGVFLHDPAGSGWCWLQIHLGFCCRVWVIIRLPGLQRIGP